MNIFIAKYFLLLTLLGLCLYIIGVLLDCFAIIYSGFKVSSFLYVSCSSEINVVENISEFDNFTIKLPHNSLREFYGYADACAFLSKDEFTEYILKIAVCITKRKLRKTKGLKLDSILFYDYKESNWLIKFKLI